MQDLDRLIPPGSGWRLTVARALNRRGQIVGYGSCELFPKHRWRAFLLTPEGR